MISGVVLFIYQNQTWLLPVSLALFLIGIVLLGVEGIARRVKKQLRNSSVEGLERACSG